jgi:hypothetical protein
VEEIIMGRVFEHEHATPASRTIPRIGDTVWVRAGEHHGRVGRVSGRLDSSPNTVWTVVTPDGVVLGVYVYAQLSIIVEGS